jgi:hypothetical protein
MAKVKVTDWSETASDNTDIGGTGIQGTNAVQNFDNALRELMAQIAKLNAGTDYIHDSFTFADPGDPTKQFRFDGGAVTAGQTRVFSVPDSNGTLVTLEAAQTITGAKTFSTSAEGTVATFTSTHAGANPGPNISLFRDSASPAANDFLTALEFNGRDSAANTQNYGAVRARIIDPTSGTEDGELILLTVKAGTLSDSLHLRLGAYMEGATGGDKGAGTFNATALYQNGSRVTGTPDAVIEDRKAQGTDGGTFTQDAWQTRTLNTEARDPDGLVSLSSNQFTPTVNGWVEWEAPAYEVNAHQTRLYNVTDAAAVASGTSELAGAAVNSTNRSTGGAAVTGGKAYRIEHYCGTTKATTGFGPASNIGGEVYTRVRFWRTA